MKIRTVLCAVIYTCVLQARKRQKIEVDKLSCGTGHTLLQYPKDEGFVPMTLNLESDIADGLATIASVRGLTVEEYLRQLIHHELAATRASDIPVADESSGMVMENGLLIYGAGTELPAAVIDAALRRSREGRSKHILGNLS